MKFIKKQKKAGKSPSDAAKWTNTGISKTLKSLGKIVQVPLAQLEIHKETSSFRYNRIY